MQRIHFEIEARHIGRIAHQVLTEDQPAAIFGITSRGIFIRPGGRWLIFVSYERYRSPLTVTLNEAAALLRPVKVGASLQVQSGKLIFPAAGVIISWPEEAKVWRSPPPPAQVNPLPERMERLRRFVRAAVTAKNGPGFSRLLPPLLGWPVEGELEAEQTSALAAMVRAQHALRDGNITSALENIANLLGAGRGLTPSGDDFVIGLLLMLNRRPDSRQFQQRLSQFNRQIVSMAYQKTTTISANLIECAAFGQSDERLVNVVDYLVAGQPVEEPANLSGLLGWGASSGIDALAGLVVGSSL